MEDLLYRIFNRKIIFTLNKKLYTVKAPSAELRYLAEVYKQGLIDENKYDLPHIDFYNNFLIQNKFIESDYESKIKNMNEAIQRLKVDLYNAAFRIEECRKIRKNLQIMKNKLNSYYNKIEFHRHQSLQYFAESLKNKYILINTIYHNDELVFNIDDLDMNLLGEIISYINDLDINTADFRKMARSDNWRTYWLGNKYNLFGIPAIEFSEDQKILCMFSRMYDNIYEHPERPADDIIEDDDKLDGWLIIEQKKNKENQKGKSVTNIDPSYPEVFKAAISQEEANNIYSEANTSDGKRILKERAQVLKTKEEVKDINFRDVKLDILASSAQAQSKHIKNIGK